MEKDKRALGVTKAKKTKLSKKTVEELVDIILRKDDVERKNNEEIKRLQNSLAQSDIDYDKLVAQVREREEEAANAAEKAAGIVDRYQVLKAANKLLKDDITAEVKKNKTKNSLLLGCIIIILGLIVLLFLN